jgi:hypothetical protein
LVVRAQRIGPKQYDIQPKEQFMASGKEDNSKDYGWVPYFGEFEVEKETILFRGKRIVIDEQAGSIPSEEKDKPAVGLILSSHTLADGRISADVKYLDVTPDTICEIAVAYDSNADHTVTAGLGSEQWAMFGIREFGGPRTGGKGLWWDYRVGGDRSNLRANKTYHIEVQLRGALIILLIDGVAVGTAEVSSPMGRPRQVGILCKGDHDIQIQNFKSEGTKPKAFVVMQFGGEFDEVYHDVVKEVCKSYEVNVLRADEVSGPGLIIGDIVRELATSQLVIADITPSNANVYFEVGYALALSKPTILLAQKGTALPFDVAGFRVLFYEDTIGGKKRLEDGLKRHLDAILAG